MTRPETVCPSGFPAGRLERLIEIEESHFWFAGRRSLVDRLLKRYVGVPPKTVVDLGAGAGGTAEQLAALGYQAAAVDYLPAGLQRLRARTECVHVVRSEISPLALRDGSFDAALALDVMEHVDDRAALSEVHRVLKPCGILILTVPAFPWLWSFRDEAAHHRRRYHKAQLRQLLRNAHFRVHYLSYYQFILFPLLMLNRLTSPRSMSRRDLEDLPSRPVNAVLGWVNRAEAHVGGWRPWGSSLVAVACREDQ